MDESIILVNDWDYQPKIGDKKIGHHIIREKENSILLDFLTRRNEGSFLLCGHRGTGKTSSLFSAVNEAVQQRKFLLPILIKATSIQFEPNKQQESVVKHLIGSLHKKIKDDNKIASDFKKKTKNLYNNSIASKIENKTISSNEKVVEKTSFTKINVILPIILVISGLSFLISQLTPYSWILSLISASLGGILVFDYTKKTWKKSSELTSSEIVNDYVFSNLISEFEELLEDTNNKYKILFILDEVDKIHDQNPLTIIHDLKMLINQSNALFLFITTPDILPSIGDRDSTNYTLFPEKLFLKRPLFDEMKKFIDSIVDFKTSQIKQDNHSYQNLKNYFCYMSKTSFFELYHEIRDFIHKDKDKQFINVSLDNTQTTQANLQLCIEWIYNRKKQETPSQWQTNDKILDVLYKIVNILEDTPINQNIVINDDQINIGKTSNRFPVRYEFSSVIDLFELLVRQGYLTKVNDTTYSIVGSLPKFTTNLSGIFVEEETTFMDAYKKFRKEIVNFVNLKTKWIDESSTPFSIETFEAKWPIIQLNLTPFSIDLNTFNDTKDSYAKLTSSQPPIIAPELLQAQTNKLRSVSNLINRYSLTVLNQIFQKQLNMTVQSMTSDISQGHFSTLRFSNRNMQNATLSFNIADKKIDKIVFAISPTIEFLDEVKEREIISNNIIFYLGDAEQFSNYKNNNYVISTSELLKNEIENLIDLEDKKKNIFFAMELPLQADKLEKIISILKTIPIK